ncbi:hypothetical protein E2C01_077213 [Portunus trituberculatus]|uniref:Uncharacterized protein n=1 Tax=Portunus trituberculatus TaxID=210409 RepID=A0A5B7IAU1_PORTR|nr:hypothetical protein [Portunus trituberculatus]
MSEVGCQDDEQRGVGWSRNGEQLERAWQGMSEVGCQDEEQRGVGWSRNGEKQYKVAGGRMREEYWIL